MENRTPLAIRQPRHVSAIIFLSTTLPAAPVCGPLLQAFGSAAHASGLRDTRNL